MAPSSPRPVKVFILSRNRPIYLWACLDALYRLTRHPARFVLIDSASSDPGVAPVIAGFGRRGLFEQVVHLDQNTPAAAYATIGALIVPGEDEAIVFIESDVVVQAPRLRADAEDHDVCWLGRLVALMEGSPTLAMLGSRVDTGDFPPVADIERLTPGLEDRERRDLIAFPERALDEPGPDAPAVIDPHNPPGRLLLLRVAALAQTGVASDFDLHQRLRVAGFETGISTEVRHRHLSSLALYDYPDYDIRARNTYMREWSYRGRADALLRKTEDPAALISPEADVHVLADGRRIEPEHEEDRYRFELPEGVERVQLVTRTGFAFGGPDDRCLGLCISQARLDGQDLMHDPVVTRDWWPWEGDRRWTAGGATPLPVGRVLELRADTVGSYLLIDLAALAGAGGGAAEGEVKIETSVAAELEASRDTPDEAV